MTESLGESKTRWVRFAGGAVEVACAPGSLDRPVIFN